MIVTTEVLTEGIVNPKSSKSILTPLPVITGEIYTYSLANL